MSERLVINTLCNPPLKIGRTVIELRETRLCHSVGALADKDHAQEDAQIQTVAIASSAGCIDLRRPEITHAYCPPNDIMPLPGSRSAAGCAMWQPGSPFVSMHNRLKPAVLTWQLENPTGSACLDILDFSTGCSSPCSVLGMLTVQNRTAASHWGCRWPYVHTLTSLAVKRLACVGTSFPQYLCEAEPSISVLCIALLCHVLVRVH